MHNLVAYQWFATYVALFTLPYLGHHWKGTTEIGVFLIGKALVVKTDFLPNRDDLGGFIHVQTWRCRFPDGTQNTLLQFWNVIQSYIFGMSIKSCDEFTKEPYSKNLWLQRYMLSKF